MHRCQRLRHDCQWGVDMAHHDRVSSCVDKVVLWPGGTYRLTRIKHQWYLVPFRSVSFHSLTCRCVLTQFASGVFFYG